MDEEEKNIFQKLKGDDQTAFKYFFEKYYNSLCSISKLLLFDSTFVEEIVQDVFIEVWEKRKTIIINTSVKGYLFMAVKHKCYNWNDRKINKREILDMEFAENYFRVDSHQVVMEKNELEEIIKESVNNIPPQAKQAFKLKYIEGMSQKEISLAMKVSENTVEKHLSYARMYLKKNFPSKILKS